MIEVNMKFNVFGRLMSIEKIDGKWRAFTQSNEGKRREIPEAVIPLHIEEGDLERYLADIFHENASEIHSEVKKMD